MRVTVIPIVIGALGHQRIDKGTGGFGNKKTSRDYPNDNIIKIGPNAAKNLGDLLSFRFQGKTRWWEKLSNE